VADGEQIQGLPEGATLRPLGGAPHEEIEGLPEGAEVRPLEQPKQAATAAAPKESWFHRTFAPRPVERTDFKGAPPVPGSFEGHPENIGEYVPATIGEAAGGLKDFATAAVTPGGDPHLAAHGAHRMISGTMSTAAPVLPFAAAAVPVGTALTLGAGAVGQKIGEKGAEYAGAGPEYQELAGDAGALLTGFGGAKLRGGAKSIREAAMEDPNVAAQKALKPPPKKAVQMQQNLAEARPYLKGADSLGKLQETIPKAKAEIWKPYKDAIEKVGDKKVTGPDGETTVAQLEKDRLQVSADLDTARKMQPTDRQTALQKQSTVKELMDRDAAIKEALDPELQKAGVNPKLIRRVHGTVKGIEKLTEGRNTLTENKPYGFGKMAEKFSLTRPGQTIRGIGSGVRDIAAGRPLWSGSPTDVAVREGFRTGGEKPNLMAAQVPQFAPAEAPIPMEGWGRGGRQPQMFEATPPAELWPESPSRLPWLERERLSGRLGKQAPVLPAPPAIINNPIEPAIAGRSAVEAPRQTYRDVDTGKMQRGYKGEMPPAIVGHTAEGGPMYERSRAPRRAERYTEQREEMNQLRLGPGKEFRRVPPSEANPESATRDALVKAIKGVLEDPLATAKAKAMAKKHLEDIQKGSKARGQTGAREKGIRGGEEDRRSSLRDITGPEPMRTSNANALRAQLRDPTLPARDRAIIQAQLDDLLAHPFERAEGETDINRIKAVKEKRKTRAEAERGVEERKKGRRQRFGD
jgi:hypothetical protein